MAASNIKVETEVTYHITLDQESMWQLSTILNQIINPSTITDQLLDIANAVESDMYREAGKRERKGSIAIIKNTGENNE